MRFPLHSIRWPPSDTLNCINIHTYIHNCPVQSFSQDYDLASHTTHVVYVNFIREWRNLQLNIDSERQIFEKFFSWQIYLLSEFLPEICWEKIARKIFFFFIFRFDAWSGIRTQAFTSNKPTLYLLDCNRVPKAKHVIPLAYMIAFSNLDKGQIGMYNSGSQKIFPHSDVTKACAEFYRISVSWWINL